MIAQKNPNTKTKIKIEIRSTRACVRLSFGGVLIKLAVA